MVQDSSTQEWWKFLDEPMQELVKESLMLVDRETSSEQTFPDYGFVVFPIAKAYEGFLKKVLYELNLISNHQLIGRHFRIGRSLNPDLPERYRDESWLYDDLERLFINRGELKLARDVWEGWSKGRNKLFHYFQKENEFIKLPEARLRVEFMITIMERVVGVLAATPSLK